MYLSTATAFTTIQQLRKMFSQFGIPDTIASDNGSQFTATEFQDFCRVNGILHIKVAPYHPSSNGLAERAIRIVKEGLKKLSVGAITDQLSRILYQYRITPQTTTGISPAELLLGRKIKSCLDILRPAVEDQVIQRQSQQKARSQEFGIGDHVFVRNRTQGERWLSGSVTGKSGPLSFRVTVQDGRTVRCHQVQIRSREESDSTQPRTSVESGDDYGPFISANDHTTTEGSTNSTMDNPSTNQPQDTATELNTAETASRERLPNSGTESAAMTTTTSATPQFKSDQDVSITL